MNQLEVNVVNAVDPSNFCIQIIDNGNLDKLLATVKVDQLKKPILMKECEVLCYDETNQRFFRCSYIGKSDSSPKSLVFCHFMDKPNILTCPEDHVYKIPDKFSTRHHRPLFIKNCSVSAGQHEDWSKTQIQRFKDIIKSTKLTAEIVYSSRSNIVRLYANGRSVLNLLNESTTKLTSGKCHVLSVISAKEIYLLTNAMKSKLNFMNESLTYMNVMSMQPVKDLGEALSASTMLVCYSPDVDAWYRSKIVKIIDANTAQVFFVDCGYKVVVTNSPENLRVCSVELACFEPLATACAYDSDKPFSEWSDDDLRILKSSIEGQVLMVKVCDRVADDSDRPLVKFLNANDNKEVFEFPVAHYPYRRGSFDGTGCIVYYSVNVDSTVDMYLHAFSDIVLSDTIERCLHRYDEKRSIKLSKYRVGELCVVHYETSWYRGKILSISSSNIPVFSVNLIDYGEIVEVSTVYAVHSSLMTVYPLAVKATLYKCSGLDQQKLDLIKEFTDNSTKLFLRFIPGDDNHCVRIFNENRVDQFPPNNPADDLKPLSVYPNAVKLIDNHLYCGKFLYRSCLKIGDSVPPNDCYIRLNSDEAMQSKVNSVLSSCQLSMIPYGTDLTIGGVCLVNVNDTFYRAAIVKEEVNLITVLLVDLGCSKMFRREEIYQLPKNLESIPHLARYVRYSADDVILSSLQDPDASILIRKIAGEENLFRGVLGQCAPRDVEILFDSFQARVVHISKDFVYIVRADENAPLLDASSLKELSDDFLVIKSFDCVVKMSSSNDCARARISTTDNAEHPYSAFLLDRGLTILVSRDQLYSLPPHLYAQHPVAVPCKFSRQVSIGESLFCQIVSRESDYCYIFEPYFEPYS